MSIPDLRREGKNDTEIADMFGCSRPTIQRWLRELRKLGVNVPKGKRGRRKILC